LHFFILAIRITEAIRIRVLLAFRMLETTERATTFWDCRWAIDMTLSKVVLVAEFLARAEKHDGAVGTGVDRT
jgi:hypothetical protein